MTSVDALGAAPQPPQGRRVVLWRHGQTDHNAAGIWQGHLDTELSATGREQADAAAQALVALSPTVVVASDLQRARATAEALTARLRASGRPVVLRTDPQLREIAVGRWQGLTKEEAAALTPGIHDALGRGEDARRGGTGETFAELTARVGAALDDVTADLAAGECAVVATHGVAARAAAAYLLRNDDARWRARRSMGNGCWAVLDETGPLTWSLTAWDVGVGAQTGPPPVA